MSVIYDYIGKRIRDGKTACVLCGGRRSGKTYAILKLLLTICEGFHRTIVNVASMTNEQGRLGAYADCKDIMTANPNIFDDVEVLTSPRELRFANGSRIFFNSYQNSETAKGVACDYLFLNEANNFSKQQYTDLRANVRRMTFMDFNPNIKFWVDDFFTDDDICRTTWKDNPYLTAAQLEYFADLKRMAERPGATSVDRRNYAVYYLGEYAEIDGAIFNKDNMKKVGELPKGLRHFVIFSDPSALRGADWFASCLTAQDADGNVYLVDSFSINEGGREVVVRKYLEWCKAYDVEDIYIETNGIIGIDFYDFASNSGLRVSGWNSRRSKFERIVENYQNLTTRLFILDSPMNDIFMRQVYEFCEKCAHDDNIDALNSSYNLQQFIR